MVSSTFLVIQNSRRADRASVIEVRDGNAGTGIAGMHHPASADIHGHMVDTLAVAVKDQISRLYVADADLRAAIGLGSGGMGKGDAEVFID